MERNSRQNFEVKASHFACSTIKRSAGVSALWKNGVRIAAFRSHGRAPAIREAGAPNVSFSRGAVPWKIIRRTTMGTSSLPARLSKHMTTSRRDRKSVVWGKRVSVRVDLGGRGIIKKKKQHLKS